MRHLSSRLRACPSRPGGRLGQALKFFGRDARGVGAIEFALVAPLLLVLYMGGVDVTRAVMFHQKLQQATAAITDIAAQGTDLTKTDLAQIFDVADAMLVPFDMKDFTVATMGVKIDAAGVAKVEWSAARGVAAPAKGSVYTVPARMASLRDMELIVTEAHHTYAPIAGYVISTKISMSASAVARARGRSTVTCKDCTS